MKTWTKNLIDTWSVIYAKKKTFRKLWQPTSSPVVFETPANRPHQRRRLWQVLMPPRSQASLSSFLEERRERTLGTCREVTSRNRFVRSLMRLRGWCSKSQQLLLGICRKHENTRSRRIWSIFLQKLNFCSVRDTWRSSCHAGYSSLPLSSNPYPVPSGKQCLKYQRVCHAILVVLPWSS